MNESEGAKPSITEVGVLAAIGIKTRDFATKVRGCFDWLADGRAEVGYFPPTGLGMTDINSFNSQDPLSMYLAQQDEPSGAPSSKDA